MFGIPYGIVNKVYLTLLSLIPFLGLYGYLYEVLLLKSGYGTAVCLIL